MKARRVRNKKLVLGKVAIEERIWAVPHPVSGSAHGYKYSLALIVDGECVLRYDNERAKAIIVISGTRNRLMPSCHWRS